MSTQSLIAQLWQRNQPQILERLALLDRTAAAAQSSTLPSDLKDEATSIAHKLAGSLGMFGFPAGTDLARAFEHELESPTPNPATLLTLTTQLRHCLFPPPDSPSL